jgi:hypothetical protein
MANISAIKLPNGTTYTLKDNGALQLTGGQVTGPVSFGDSVSIDEATLGDLVVNGSASFTNGIANFKSVSVSLPVASWSSNSQTVTVSGVTATNTVVVSPAPASFGDYSTSVVHCTAQGSNSLTFTCSEVPAGALTVNVLIMNI